MNNQIGLIKRFSIGLQKKKMELLSSVFLSYAAIWTIIEPLISFSESAKEIFSGNFKYIVFILASLIIGIIKVIKPHELTLRYNNNVIRIIFDDLLSQTGYIAIPVSRFMLETDVVKKSLQGQVIQLFIQEFEGDKGLKEYLSKLENKLSILAHKKKVRNFEDGEEKFFPLGTMADVQLIEKKFLMFALTKTELQNHVPPDNCNLSDLVFALEAFLVNAKQVTRGNALNLPLIGSGVSGINLDPQKILEINLVVLISVINRVGSISTDEVRIVIHPKYFEIIDLEKILLSASLQTTGRLSS